MVDTHELERLKSLDDFQILDTAPEEAFDRITRVAMMALDVPISLVSLVDEKRQWFKSRQGLEAPETPREISFCTHAIKENQPFIVNDTHEDSRFRFNPLVTGHPDIRFYAGVPLRTHKGHNLGTLCVIDREPRHISRKELSILQDLARIVVDEMELRLVASSDCLTGLQRRRAFMSKAELEFERAKRYGHDLSIVVMDIDHFKSVNDRYGHAVGDLVLQHVANICRANLRSMDLVARIGGEEFVLLLPETNLLAAHKLAERLRTEIETSAVENSGALVKVTTSFGIADRESSGLDELKSMINEADRMLYEAKGAGRNQTMPREA